MEEFFEPWRRRVGVLTLGLACTFVAVWVSSMINWPEVYCCNFQVKCSADGIMVQLKQATIIPRTDGTSSINLISHFVMPSLISVTIPFWSFTIPLTLISLWLLLVKPRQSTEQKIDEQNFIEGA